MANTPRGDRLKTITEMMDANPTADPNDLAEQALRTWMLALGQIADKHPDAGLYVADAGRTLTRMTAAIFAPLDQTQLPPGTRKLFFEVLERTANKLMDELEAFDRSKAASKTTH